MTNYIYIVIQVVMTFTGGYLWHLADTKPLDEKTKMYYYAAAFVLLAMSLYIILTVHMAGVK